MKKDKKVIAAISAAVYEFIKSQEAMIPEAVAEAAVFAPQPVALPSLWNVAGRQRMMTMRQLVQMRSFRNVSY